MYLLTGWTVYSWRSTRITLAIDKFYMGTTFTHEVVLFGVQHQNSSVCYGFETFLTNRFFSTTQSLAEISYAW